MLTQAYISIGQVQLTRKHPAKCTHLCQTTRYHTSRDHSPSFRTFVWWDYIMDPSCSRSGHCLIRWHINLSQTVWVMVVCIFVQGGRICLSNTLGSYHKEWKGCYEKIGWKCIFVGFLILNVYILSKVFKNTTCKYWISGNYTRVTPNTAGQLCIQPGNVNAHSRAQLPGWVLKMAASLVFDCG